MFDDEGKVHLPEPKIDPVSINPRVMDLERQVRELELELAQTKLALVESECKTQDLTHQLNNAVTEIQASKNTWFHKTINSIKEVTNVQKKEGGTITRRDSGSSGSLKRKDSATKES